MDYVGQFSGEEIDARLRLVTEKMDKAERFTVQSDEYLTFAAGKMSLAVIIEHEDNVLPPIFVTGDNYERFFVSAVEGWDIPVSFVSGTIEYGRVLAIHNGFDGEGSIPVVVKVVSLTGDELPEIFTTDAGGFDEEPTPFPVRYLYAKPAGGIPASDMASGVQTSLGKADTALQPVSGATNGNLAGLNSQGKVVDSGKKPSDFAAANLVPAQASPSNQLADKNFVNSSIQTETATFRGNYDTWENVPDTGDAWENVPDNNDYLVVRDAGGYAPYWEDAQEYPAFEVGDIVSDFVQHDDEYALFRCIEYINYDNEEEEPTPANNTTHFERVDNNPNYEGTWRFKYPDSGDYDKYSWLPEYQVNEKPLTAAQLAALNSGITDTKVAKLDALPATIPTEVFWATYGVTTVAEVEAALTAGKIVMCNYNNTNHQLTLVDSTNYTFTAVASSQVIHLLMLKISDDTWTNDTSILQKTSNLVTSFQNTPDDTHYPSEKLVYDSLYKKGVISQTQTWTHDANYVHSYVMSDLIWGNIPKSNIDMFEAAGATFNDTTGYFELNGLTDISYREMQQIALNSTYGLKYAINLDYVYRGANARTVYPLITAGGNRTLSARETFNSGGYLEVIKFSPSDSLISLNNPNYCFRECLRLKTIIGIFTVLNEGNTAFYNNRTLENITFVPKVSVSFYASSVLSVASILYMINNEAATSAITITLHATAYARATADADITAALQNHPNVSLASA